MPLNYLKELLQLSLLLKATADSLQYTDVNVLFPNIPLSLLGGRDIHCILRSPAAAGAVTNGSPAAAAAAQFLGCSFC